MSSITSPLLQPKSHALEDPSFGTSGLVARELALDSELDLEDAQNYGSIPQSTHDDSVNNNNDDAPTELTSTEQNIVVATLLIGSFLAALDTTIVTTLLSTIGSDINAMSKSSLIGTAYLLSASAFQPLYGKVSDIFGRKSCLIFANAVFAFGCIITGLTHTLTGITLSRFITGVGGCGLNALGVITISDLIPLRQRGLYQGYGNIAFGSGAALGGVFGALVDKWFGWEYAFFSQVPIALLSIVLLSKHLKLPKGSKGLGMTGSRWEKFMQVDFLGSTLLVTSLLAFMILVSFVGEDIVVNGLVFWILIIYSTVAIFAFGYVELYVARQPIIPVRLLTHRTVLSSSLVNWFMSMSVFTYLYYLPIFWASVQGLSPTQIGYRNISNFVGVSVGSFGAGLYMRKTGKYYWFFVIASVMTVFGTVLNYYSSRSTPVWVQYTQLFVPGAGYASMLTVTLLALIASVSHEHQASTTALQYGFRSTGSTIGVSVAGLIFQRALMAQLTDKLFAIEAPDYTKKQVLEIINKAFDSATFIKTAPEIFRPAIVDSYDISTHKTLFFSVVTILLTFAAGLLIQEHHLHTTVNRK